MFTFLFPLRAGPEARHSLPFGSFFVCEIGLEVCGNGPSLAPFSRKKHNKTIS
jgi:hypothetical protein